MANLFLRSSTILFSSSGLFLGSSSSTPLRRCFWRCHIHTWFTRLFGQRRATAGTTSWSRWRCFWQMQNIFMNLIAEVNLRYFPVCCVAEGADHVWQVAQPRLMMNCLPPPPQHLAVPQPHDVSPVVLPQHVGRILGWGARRECSRPVPRCCDLNKFL